MGCHALLQGIFLTQGSNLRLLSLPHWQVGSYHCTRAVPLCVRAPTLTEGQSLVFFIPAEGHRLLDTKEAKDPNAL